MLKLTDSILEETDCDLVWTSVLQPGMVGRIHCRPLNNRKVIEYCGCIPPIQDRFEFFEEDFPPEQEHDHNKVFSDLQAAIASTNTTLYCRAVDGIRLYPILKKEELFQEHWEQCCELRFGVFKLGKIITSGPVDTWDDNTRDMYDDWLEWERNSAIIRDIKAGYQ